MVLRLALSRAVFERRFAYANRFGIGRSTERLGTEKPLRMSTGDFDDPFTKILCPPCSVVDRKGLLTLPSASLAHED